MAHLPDYQDVLSQIDTILDPNDNWVILINADPDAMACALSLKRIIKKKVNNVSISHINEIKRPDNLTMIRLLGIKMFKWEKEHISEFQKFAIVDSQPHHNVQFEGISFDLVIDHHPLPENITIQSISNSTDKKSKSSTVSYIFPELGACASFFTELLISAKVSIGKKLATALQYAIRTDTHSFGTRASSLDFRAYQKLNAYADHSTLMRILRSEYLPEWLPYFAQGIESLTTCADGYLSFIGIVQNPDLLVVVADFFQKVHSFKWVAVSGTYNDTLIVIFRGCAECDLGALASKAFSDYGSAGGHPHMARAEIPLKNTSQPLAQFIQIQILSAKNDNKD